jgi:septum formation protein
VAEAILHLASTSPRRREILAALGVRHTWAGVDIDEAPLNGELPAEMVLRLACGKARACREVRSHEPLILAADTIVVLDSHVFGKASAEEEGLFMLAALSGRTHKVLTAIALNTPERELTAVCETDVRMREIDPEEALRYWRSGEPSGKAGAYAIQGIGGIFVEALTGSYSGVVGLPVFETAGLLREAGVDVLLAGSSGPRS